jgi:tetratricopeptide (TPR) repeat protein
MSPATVSLRHQPSNLRWITLKKTWMRKIATGLIMLLATSPAWAQAQNENAMLCASGAPETSIAGCTAVIQSGQDAATMVLALTNRGAAYRMKNLYDQAIADFTQAIALNPNLAVAYVARAGSYVQKKMYDQAIAARPDDVKAYLCRGNAYSDKGLLDQAIADFAEVIRRAPDDALAYNNRGWTFHLKGEDAFGLPDAEKAITLEPKQAAFLETRAEIYEKLGRRADAIADYRSALAVDTNMKLADDMA